MLPHTHTCHTLLHATRCLPHVQQCGHMHVSTKAKYDTHNPGDKCDENKMQELKWKCTLHREQLCSICAHCAQFCRLDFIAITCYIKIKLSLLICDADTFEIDFLRRMPRPNWIRHVQRYAVNIEENIFNQRYKLQSTWLCQLWLIPIPFARSALATRTLMKVGNIERLMRVTKVVQISELLKLIMN